MSQAGWPGPAGALGGHGLAGSVVLMVLMVAIALAGCQVYPRSFGPAELWRVVFAASACWFAGQGVRGLARRRPARGGPEAADGRAGATGHAATGPFVHVLACGAMLVMLAGPAGGPSAPAAMTAGPAGPGGGALPLLAVVCAVGLLASVVLATDRLAALARVPGAGTLAIGPPGAPMSLRLAACCDIAVGVTMGYLLILMIS